MYGRDAKARVHTRMPAEEVAHASPVGTPAGESPTSHHLLAIRRTRSSDETGDNTGTDVGPVRVRGVDADLREAVIPD
jgi:hypothetical protein